VDARRGRKGRGAGLKAGVIAAGARSVVGERAFRYSGPVLDVLGRILEVAAMLTLGVALVVYGFGEKDMNAELGWLLAGSVLFLIGYALERRSERGR
jgi:hypothetical protein